MHTSRQPRHTLVVPSLLDQLGDHVGAQAGVHRGKVAGPDHEGVARAAERPVTLSGGALDGDTGDTPRYRWTVTGPGAVTMATPNAATTTASFSVTGDYVYRLTMTDSQGATGFDEAT